MTNFNQQWQYTLGGSQHDKGIPFRTNTTYLAHAIHCMVVIENTLDDACGINCDQEKDPAKEKLRLVRQLGSLLTK